MEASYQTTAAIAVNGLGPFLWIPLANRFGRRPVLLFTTLLGFATILGAASATSFAALVGVRVVNGLWPAAMALGPAVVVDCFALGARGRATGVFTVLLTTGAHVAPIMGGLVGEFLGWRWTFKLAAIMDGVMFLVVLVGFPETLYFRHNANRDATIATATISSKAPTAAATRPSYFTRLAPYAGPFPAAPRLRAASFVLPVLRMARYPSVLFPAIYYGAQYGFGSILPAVTVAAVFSERFGWHTLAIGLAYGGALTVGGVLGEFFAGPVLDALVRRAGRRAGDGEGRRMEPEERLKAVWIGAVGASFLLNCARPPRHAQRLSLATRGADIGYQILLPVGLLIYGFTIQYRVHWFVPLFGMGLSCFGLQPIATTCYTYSIDCHREQGGDVATLFNFVRQMFGMTFAFYAVRLCQRIGYQFAFVLFAVWGSLLAFLPILVLMWRGKDIREWARKRDLRE